MLVGTSPTAVPASRGPNIFIYGAAPPAFPFFAQLVRTFITSTSSGCMSEGDMVLACSRWSPSRVMTRAIGTRSSFG